MNGKHQPLFYASDINMLGKNINTIMKNVEVLLKASREGGLETNTEKAKYMFMFRHQNAEQPHNLLTVNNKSLGNVASSILRNNDNNSKLH